MNHFYHLALDLVVFLPHEAVVSLFASRADVMSSYPETTTQSRNGILPNRKSNFVSESQIWGYSIGALSAVLDLTHRIALHRINEMHSLTHSLPKCIVILLPSYSLYVYYVSMYLSRDRTSSAKVVGA